MACSAIISELVKELGQECLHFSNNINMTVNMDMYIKEQDAKIECHIQYI